MLSELKKILRNENIFETGLNKIEIKNSSFIENLPNDLLKILLDSNGQKIDSNPIFFEFKNDSSGMILWWYNY